MTSELKDRMSPGGPVASGSLGTLTVGTLTVETLTVQAPAVQPPRPDHVRSHSRRCYWDFVECRWRCSRD